MQDLISQIVSTFSHFDVNSAFDILIVTVLFYGVLMLLRGTRADQVLRGVLLLFIFFAVAASVFHLTMVDWLLHNSPLVLLVAIPIIFQPEIRRALEQVGRTSAVMTHPLATLQTPLQPPTAVEEIVDGAERLAERHYGALIVLEGATGLEDFVRSGVRVDGFVSSDFLVNIFFLHAPLHDGAVIIRGDRVLAAGCVLPLSEDTIGSEYGTRHRAAIGITEQTDALSIVVSEETGSISVARGGHIQSGLSPERLRRYLDAFYSRQTVQAEERVPASVGS